MRFFLITLYHLPLLSVHSIQSLHSCICINYFYYNTITPTKKIGSTTIFISILRSIVYMIAHETVIDILQHDIAQSCRFAIQLVKNLISDKLCSQSQFFNSVRISTVQNNQLPQCIALWAICSSFKQTACCFANDSSW
jgi:hypothetical protein